MKNNIIDNIKINEGFDGNVYKDTLGFDTIGYGTKLPLSREESELLLKSRLDDKIVELSYKYEPIKDMPQSVVEVLIEMSYQMGVDGLLKFKKMLNHLENKDYKLASIEGLDSKWAKQTPNRASKLMSIISEI